MGFLHDEPPGMALSAGGHGGERRDARESSISVPVTRVDDAGASIGRCADGKLAESYHPQMVIRDDHLTTDARTP
jgi:hypothetical protein